MPKTKDTYVLINHRPESSYPEGARFYDEGVADYEAGKPMLAYSSRSYRDGWKDMAETSIPPLTPVQEAD